jgi:hypothetical protein
MAADGLGIFIESRSIRHVASSIVGHDCNVITYFFILRKTGLRVERIAHWDVDSPGHAAIGAKGVE